MTQPCKQLQAVVLDERTLQRGSEPQRVEWETNIRELLAKAGDIDPSVIDYLSHKEGLSLPEMITLLNKHAGLLGISGMTSDMRELLAVASGGVVFTTIQKFLPEGRADELPAGQRPL